MQLCSDDKSTRGCGDGCINRASRYQCAAESYPCGERCSNRQLQVGSTITTAVVDCGRRGVGVILLEPVDTGRYIGESTTTRSTRTCSKFALRKSSTRLESAVRCDSSITVVAQIASLRSGASVDESVVACSPLARLEPATNSPSTTSCTAFLSEQSSAFEVSRNYCDNSLAKDSIPKFSIKNGFAIGTLPTHLADASLPERLITQPVSVVAVTRVMRGGAHRFIRSHCLAFDFAPAPAATLLPIQPDCISTYRVVLAGPFTTEQ
ncbi:hypothetical protein PF008_g22627 [Phytophthora fragariae]|uniref:AWS domain-containing protein n=1 Tax=Phytophthora fragariae TaxID=53985 RepID=A0A6G0QTT7_9STRA|nr:hypothetical protein PF008_g22627 [Phytophthora fragariae]